MFVVIDVVAISTGHGDAMGPVVVLLVMVPAYLAPTIIAGSRRRRGWSRFASENAENPRSNPEMSAMRCQSACYTAGMFAYWITGPHYFYVPQPNAQSFDLDALIEHAKVAPKRGRYHPVFARSADGGEKWMYDGKLYANGEMEIRCGVEQCEKYDRIRNGEEKWCFHEQNMECRNPVVTEADRRISTVDLAA